MQPLSDIADVQISTTGGGLSLDGFGTPFILGAYGKAWPERIRFYKKLDDVAVDFLATDPEYIAASRVFGQTPCPAKVAIGRGTRKPTQVFKVAIPLDAAIPASTKIALNIAGTEVSYTTDANPTRVELAGGLLAAINAGTATHHLTAVAAGDSSYLTVTNGTAGAWTRVELVDVAPGVQVVTLEATTADPGVAADMNEIKIESSDFYIVCGYAWLSADIAAAFAAWAGTNEKIFLGCTFDTAVPNVADAGATDVGHAFKAQAYTRGGLYYDPDGGAFLDAAIAGRCLPYDAGSETWALKTLSGVVARNYTATQLANLVAKRVGWFNAIAGRNVTSPDSGKVAANEWIDVVRGRDALKQDMQAAIFARLSDPTVKKIPYTDKGAAVIAGEVAASLKRFEATGFLVEGSTSVTVPAVKTQSAQDRANRYFPGITFEGEIAGAIHKVKISGVLV